MCSISASTYESWKLTRAKAAAPAFVLFFSWIFHLTQPTSTVVTNIGVIVLGVGLASYGELELSTLGIYFQFGGLVFEAIRLALSEKLLNGASFSRNLELQCTQMDPLVSLYYYSPICMVFNIAVWLAVEMRSFQVEKMWSLGPGILLLNAAVAFLLNVASVLLVCPSLPS